eukprot:5883922-Pleurochrysis_carterae.AAC.4
MLYSQCSSFVQRDSVLVVARQSTTGDSPSETKPQPRDCLDIFLADKRAEYASSVRSARDRAERGRERERAERDEEVEGGRAEARERG